MHQATEAPEPEEHQVSNSPNSRSLNEFELFWTVIVKQICRNAHKFYSFFPLVQSNLYWIYVFSDELGFWPGTRSRRFKWAVAKRAKICRLDSCHSKNLSDRSRFVSSTESWQSIQCFADLPSFDPRKKEEEDKKKKLQALSCHAPSLEPINHLKFCKMSSPLQSMQVFANTMIRGSSFKRCLPGRIQGNAFHLPSVSRKLMSWIWLSIEGSTRSY